MTEVKLTEADRLALEGDESGLLLAWEVPEFDKHDRSPRWYAIVGTISIVLVVYAVLTANFLFAIIILMGALIMFLSHRREPNPVPFAITVGGIFVGNHFHPYHEFRHFSILYEPPDVKRLYLASQGTFRPIMHISLEDMDPNIVRETLLGFLPEDLTKVEEGLGEFFSRVYKL